jgi:LEA14-like dessication related protein
MRPVRPVRILAAALVALLALAAGCKSLQDMAGMAQKPTAHVVGTSVRGLSLTNIVLLFDIEVANPYAVAVPLADLSYALDSGGHKLLSGSIQPSGSIPAKGKQVIQLPVTVAFAPVLTAMKGVKPGAVLPYTADFRLGIDAPAIGRLEAPFSRKGELPIPTVPEVELSSFEVGKLGLDRTTGTAKLRIRNTNQFALDLKRVGMSFSLGGAEVGSSRVSDAASLQSGESANLEVPLSFSPRAVGASLFNLLRGKQIAYQVSGSLEANTRFGQVSIPYNKIGNAAVVKP